MKTDIKIEKVKLNLEILEKYLNDNRIVRTPDVKIIIGTDKDLDGDHIASLLLNFFYTYTPEVFVDLYRLETPIAIMSKNNKIQDWVYNINDLDKLQGDIKYMKGLGGWTQETLKAVINKDTFDGMLKQITYKDGDDEELLNWFSSQRTDIRKQKIKENNFSLIKI